MITSTSWLLDSGVSSYMTNDRSIFVTYNDVPLIPICTAKCSQMVEAVETEMILATFFFNRKSTDIHVESVLYILELTYNLVSLAKLMKKGVWFIVEG